LSGGEQQCLFPNISRNPWRTGISKFFLMLFPMAMRDSAGKSLSADLEQTQLHKQGIQK
jgi:hypothetical protein